MEIKLKDGLKVGDETVFYLSLRRLTTADLMDAETASESPIVTPVGVKLLSSPATMGYELIRRSVCQIGDDKRSLLLKELRALSEEDFNILQKSYSMINRITGEDGVSDEGR